MGHWDKRLTKFELTRVLGARALQIALGAPLLVKSKKEERPLLIARKELFEGKVPMIVIRRYPDGELERVDISNKQVIESIKGYF